MLKLRAPYALILHLRQVITKEAEGKMEESNALRLGYRLLIEATQVAPFIFRGGNEVKGQGVTDEGLVHLPHHCAWEQRQTCTCLVSHERSRTRLLEVLGRIVIRNPGRRDC